MGSNKRYPGNRHYWTVEEWRDGANVILPPIAQEENPTAGRRAFENAIVANPNRLLTLCWGARIISQHPDTNWANKPGSMPVFEAVRDASKPSLDRAEDDGTNPLLPT
jgi:hypothetical protein